MAGFDEIRSVIESCSRIVISAHTSPDGDAVGSCCGLAMALNELGKEVAVVLEEYSESFNIIPTGGLMYTSLPEGFNPDLFIALDCGDLERLGENAELFNSVKTTINIDHHMSNTNFAKYNYADEYASSASELVFRLLYGYAPFNEDIAAALYTGILYDTGGFRHSSTSPATMIAAAELMEYDFDFSGIYNKIFSTRKLKEAKGLGIALDRLETAFDGKAVYTWMTLEDMEKIGVVSDDLHAVTGFIKGIEGCEVSMFIYEKQPGTFKVSMRSEDSVDVCAVCSAFGGGGHKKASGCTLEGKPQEIAEKILQEISKQL